MSLKSNMEEKFIWKLHKIKETFSVAKIHFYFFVIRFSVIWFDFYFFVFFTVKCKVKVYVFFYRNIQKYIKVTNLQKVCNFTEKAVIVQFFLAPALFFFFLQFIYKNMV